MIATMAFHLLLLLLTRQIAAHMQLASPIPFNSTENPHRTTAPDPYLQYPFDCCGPNARWTNPCRGYHTLLGTSDGQPTATWQVGSNQTFALKGIGNHYGGSCQVGFSTDHGKTFRVLKSFEGNCPHRHNGNGPNGQEFAFNVPFDVQAGVGLFAWSWWNREQEFNTNCAAVNIETSQKYPSGGPSEMIATEVATLSTGVSLRFRGKVRRHGSMSNAPRGEGGLASTDRVARSVEVSFATRPLMFVADASNGCFSPKTTAELKFPNPGAEVEKGDGEYPLQLPEGNC